MSIEAKNKVFDTRIFYKEMVIQYICTLHGLIPDISIKDKNKLPFGQTIIQTNQPDYIFLKECAAKWNCSFFIDPVPNLFTGKRTLHFFDNDVIYKKGNNNKIANMDDLSSDYILGYRTDATMNNISNIRWGFSKPKGGDEDGASYTSMDETGKKEIKRPFTLTYEDERWQLKKDSYMKYALADPSLWKTYRDAVIEGGIVYSEVTLRKYFEKVGGVSSTNQQRHALGESVHLTVDLNIGDPWLRPPRTALLYHGSGDPKAVSAFLPYFIWENDTRNPFLIQKVTTGLMDGKISTQLEMARGPIPVKKKALPK